jgi:FAS-associated factor 2
VQTAFRASRFVLVYIHSPLHEDSDRFCSEVLSSQSVLDFAAQNNVTTWVGKVWDREAYQLSTQLKTAAFPFVALLVCQSDRAVQVAERVQGIIDLKV